MGLRRDELQERTATPPPALSPREREILAYLARGGSSKEIARDLDVAESTVTIRVQHIPRRPGVTSPVQAAAWAVRAWHRRRAATRAGRQPQPCRRSYLACS